MLAGFIENDARYAEFLRISLAGFPGCSAVRFWTSAEMFLRDTRTSELDILLIDIGLPGMSGADLVSVTSQKYPELPIVMITSLSSDDVLFKAIRGGAQAYILKSELDDLHALIQTVLDGGAVVSPSIAARILREYRNAPSGLTDLDHRLLEEVLNGRTTSELAEIIGIAEKAVKTQIRKIYGIVQQTAAIPAW